MGKSTPLVVAVIALCGFLVTSDGSRARVACADDVTPPVDKSTNPYGEISGNVEISPAVPVTDPCIVTLEGLPQSARCRADGTFHLRRVPYGERRLIVITNPDDPAKRKQSRPFAVAVNPGW